ncbi:MAG: bifunctional methylenetetrahydrofolate dehydrogenase/methenyltetrahydrofolate cyclohydrolase, partial [Betaproteobacteria bacterium]
MTATLIDGVAISKLTRESWRLRAEALKAKGVTPGLAVVIVGENPASRVYVRNKVKACGEMGLHSELIEFPESISQAEVLAKVAALNGDAGIHGILVQLPLPRHFNAERILEAIAPAKDVDGFHVENAGALATGLPGFWPCTPHGVMVMLDHHKVSLQGAEAVVVGRSNIVGKPQALMLLAKDATVTICTSKTRDLAFHTRRADVLVVATGRPGTVTGDMVKPGAVVIDVGINRMPDGKLRGDVDFEGARRVAGMITPVPGGVGPMTIAMLLANTVLSA